MKTELTIKNINKQFPELSAEQLVVEYKHLVKIKQNKTIVKVKKKRKQKKKKRRWIMTPHRFCRMYPADREAVYIPGGSPGNHPGAPAETRADWEAGQAIMKIPATVATNEDDVPWHL